MKYYSKMVFLFTLLLLVVLEFDLHLFQNIQILKNTLIILTTLSALLAVYSHSKAPKEDAEVIKKGWFYKEGVFLIVLLLILSLFTIIKAPYFDKTFTGEHSMKYNTHVEPAIYMYENNNPFLFQKKYLADPFKNPEGIANTFGSIPLTEWGLYLTYKLFPNNSYELNTRLFTHFLGIIILILSYIFFTKWFTKKQSLIIVFLMAINPIISFTTFVTVEDSWLIFFTFLSLIYFSSYLKNQNISELFWSSIFLGIGILNKTSIFLWFYPIILVLLAFKSKSFAKFLKDLGIFTTISLLPMIAFRTSLGFLPTEITPSILKFLLWILVFTLIYYLLKKYNRNIENLLNFFIKKRIVIIIIPVVIILGISFFINHINIPRYVENFLTDSTLLFNWEMYSHMLNTQFKTYITENVFFLGLIGFVFSFAFGKKDHKIILFAFLIASLIFWISASKSMFFHSYYTNIIMITFSISTGFLVCLLVNTFKNKFAIFLIILCFFLIIFPKSHQANIERLEKETLAGYIPVAQYLEGNLNDGLFVRPGSVHSPSSILSLYSGKSSLYAEKLINFKDKSLIDYNIKYVLKSEDTNFDFLNKVINAERQEQLTIDVGRTRIIQNILEQDIPPEDDIEDIEIVYKIESQLEYIKTIEGIEIYKVIP